MKLDRNVNNDGRGKYALINLRSNSIQWGNTADDEFFVIKLKDRFAEDALKAYSDAVAEYANKIGGHQGLDLFEWADEVLDLARRAADHPSRKTPD